MRIRRAVLATMLFAVWIFAEHTPLVKAQSPATASGSIILNAPNAIHSMDQNNTIYSSTIIKGKLPSGENGTRTSLRDRRKRKPDNSATSLNDLAKLLNLIGLKAGVLKSSPRG
jgi:hypothetical protein